jgi:hypothetical protein
MGCRGVRIEIVADMHEAYARVRLDGTAYGCFMMGPSATSDVEAPWFTGAGTSLPEPVFPVAE